ncbi:ATP-grasp domain-containing protein [Pseudoxanthomonas beigongshangi]
MTTIALVTAIAATGHDEDLPPLLAACERAGLSARALAWDDASVGWNRVDAAVLRSPWDYTERLPEFMAWCERTAHSALLLNPLPVIRWNTDKHYLADLAALGVPVVPTEFVEPDTEPMEALQRFLALHDAGEFVVKPAVSAGARDTQRYQRSQEFAAGNHLARLLDANRSAMLQPYLPAVDADGETALIHIDGHYSHAIRKGALLKTGDAPPPDPHALGDIRGREPAEDERQLASQALAAATRLLKLESPLLYARVDLLRGPDGAPRLLELELTEPSLFFAQAPEAADLLAQALRARLADGTVRTRTDIG